jgi:hypothetical protein
VQSATRTALLALTLTAVADGFLSASLYPGNPPSALSPVAAAATLAVSTVAFFWYRSDYLRHGTKPSPGLSVAVFAIPLVALPYYFFLNRGLKGGALGTVRVLGVALGYGIVMYIGSEIGSASRT